jgi:hypothetical protein
VDFEWDGYDASYYLLSASDGTTVSMVLVVVVPNSEYFLGCTLRAPTQDGEHIREMIPVLFANLVLNGVRLDSDALYELPEILEFPTADSP